MAGQPEKTSDRPAWVFIGTVLAVLVALAGLAIFAYVILVFVSMASFGSNK